MDTFEFAVIQDLQVSLARAYDDKQALRQLVDAFTTKLANAENIIKAANSYCQALENEDENPDDVLGVLHQAVYHWNTTTK
jgi:hypothetical protein